MRFGLLISTLLHASLVLIAAFGLPLFSTPLVIKEQPMLVELVTIAEETTPQTPPAPDEKPVPDQVAEKEAEPEPQERELPPPDVAPPPPLPKLAMATPLVRPQLEPAPAPKPTPKRVAAPPPPPPLPKLEKKPPEAPRPPKLALAPPPKPTVKPSPPPPAPKLKPVKAMAPPPVPKVPKPPPPQPKSKPEPRKKVFNPNRIAALLDKAQKERAPLRPRAETAAKRNVPVVGQRSVSAGRILAKLTMTERDAIRVQIQRCWTPPVGARGAEDLVVTIRFFLNPDGSLAGPPQIVDQALFSQTGGEFFRSAAESARRAVLRCTPVKGLPAAKYDDWREVKLNFDPKDMLQ